MDIAGALLNDEDMLGSGIHKMLFSQFRTACLIKYFTDYETCVVCSEEYDEDSELAVFVHNTIPIPHHFHMQCARLSIIASKHRNCPVCRADLQFPPGFWTESQEQRAQRRVEEERKERYNQNIQLLDIDLRTVVSEFQALLTAMHKDWESNRAAANLYANTRRAYIAELTEIRNTLEADRVQREIPAEQQPA